MSQYGVPNSLSQPLNSKLSKTFYLGLAHSSAKYREYPLLIRVFVSFLRYIFTIASFAFDIIEGSLRIVDLLVRIINYGTSFIISFLTDYSNYVQTYYDEIFDLRRIEVMKRIQEEDLHIIRKDMRKNTIEDSYLNAIFSMTIQEFISSEEKKRAADSTTQEDDPDSWYMEKMDQLPLSIGATIKLTNKAFFKAIIGPLHKNNILAALDLIFLRPLKLVLWPTMFIINTLIAIILVGFDKITDRIPLLNDIFVLLPAIFFSIPLYIVDSIRNLTKKSKDPKCIDKLEKVNESTTNMLISFEISQKPQKNSLKSTPLGSHHLPSANPEVLELNNDLASSSNDFTL